MSSAVFYKFKNQKDQKRVNFDGTGITVFELKAAIIKQSGLGDGLDIDFDIETSDDSSEGKRLYDDDTEIIFRGATVIARRSPASRPRQGRAARYVSGKPPVLARTVLKAEAPRPQRVNGVMTEEEKLAAMLNQGEASYQQQYESMANAKSIRPNYRGPPNVPKGEPPDTYICHRCAQKGHWIQACPNDTGDGENRHKFKKTTGIPRSFLEVLEKPDAIGEDGTVDMSKLPAGVMYTATGEWVVAKPDQASWEQFQDKTKAAKEKAEAQSVNNQELAELGLLCPLDERLFVDPVRTPCCGKTYSRDCIETSLLSNDLVCPGCSATEVLVDNLEVDEAKAKAVDEYKKSKEATKPQSPDASGQSPPTTKVSPVKNPLGNASTTPGSPKSATSDSLNNSKKRTAEDALENKRIPSGPSGSKSNTPVIATSPPNTANSMNGFGFQPGMIGMNPMMMGMMGMPGMMMPGMPMGMPMGMPGMPMGMPGMPGMPMGMPGMQMPMQGMPGMMNMGYPQGPSQFSHGYNNHKRNNNFNNRGGQNKWHGNQSYSNQGQRRQRSVDYRELSGTGTEGTGPTPGAQK